MNQPRRVLIFGASGALGRAMSSAVRSRNDYVLIMSSSKAIANTLENAAWVKCDMGNTGEIDTVLQNVKPDIVINLAASFIDDYDSSMQINYHASRAILDWVQRHQMKTVVILAGSSAEYGVVDAADNPIRVTHCLKPVSFYAHSKACQSLLVNLYACNGVDVRYVRIFNLEGDGVSTRLFVGRIQQQIREIQSGLRSAIETGALSAVRDYVSSEIAAAQIMDVLCNGKTGETYHIASGQPITMREMLAQMLEKAGLTDVPVSESVAHSNRRGVDVPLIYADIQKTTSLHASSEHSDINLSPSK